MNRGAGNGENGAYVFPRHPSEIDRLDVQHYAVRETMQANYLAPLHHPAAILDVGCGTGQWPIELSVEFPEALVVGFDVEKPQRKPRTPANYRFVRGNALQGVPFGDASFDFVHQRFLIAGIPVKSWASAMVELARVTRPDGWVELAESPSWVTPMGKATGQLVDMLQALLRARGLDTAGVVYGTLDAHLRRAGLIDVQVQTLELPVGDWGGQVGSLMASDARAALIRLAGAFEARFGIPAQQCIEMVAAMLEECEQRHSTLELKVAFGRKARR
jgi:ubiquinone/menaquinone biosynthesis C-methylase UbiE